MWKAVAAGVVLWLAWALPAAAQAPVVGAMNHAVVSVQNDTNRPMKFRYRWSGVAPWEPAEVAAGGRKVLAKAVGAGGNLPRLEIQVDGAARAVMLAPAAWAGAGTPGFEAGRRYIWRARKN